MPGFSPAFSSLETQVRSQCFFGKSSFQYYLTAGCEISHMPVPGGGTQQTEWNGIGEVE
jgi:hypothetical protein